MRLEDCTSVFSYCVDISTQFQKSVYHCKVASPRAGPPLQGGHLPMLLGGLFFRPILLVLH